MNSYSQLNQDINVITFFNYKNDLYFIDIGANDGLELSNTYLLEKSIIGMEYVQSHYHKLSKN